MAEKINIPYLLKQANNTFKKRNVLYMINIFEAVVYTKSRGELDSEKDYKTIRKIATKTMLKFVKDKGKKGMEYYASHNGTKWGLYPAKTNDAVQAAWDFYEAMIVPTNESGEVRVKDGRRGSIAKNIENHLKGQKFSKVYQLRLKRSKSGYTDFVNDIALELYCEAEGIEDVSKFKKSELSPTQMVDLFAIKGVAADFAKENKAKFRKHLTSNKEIFNQNGEEEIRGQAEEYFAEKLFDAIEKTRKRHGIKETIERTDKTTLVAKLGKDDDAIGIEKRNEHEVELAEGYATPLAEVDNSKLTENPVEPDEEPEEEDEEEEEPEEEDEEESSDER